MLEYAAEFVQVHGVIIFIGWISPQSIPCFFISNFPAACRLIAGAGKLGTFACVTFTNETLTNLSKEFFVCFFFNNIFSGKKTRHRTIVSDQGGIRVKLLQNQGASPLIRFYPLENGVDVYSKTYDALHFLFETLYNKKNLIAIIRISIVHKVDVKANYTGVSPFMLFLKNIVKIISWKLLNLWRENGVDVNAKNDYGEHTLCKNYYEIGY